jgi:hypothetical protein
MTGPLEGSKSEIGVTQLGDFELKVRSSTAVTHVMKIRVHAAK